MGRFTYDNVPNYPGTASQRPGGGVDVRAVQLREQHGAGEVELRLPQQRRRQVDAVEARTAQVGAVELRLAQEGPVEPRPASEVKQRSHIDRSASRRSTPLRSSRTGWSRGWSPDATSRPRRSAAAACSRRRRSRPACSRRGSRRRTRRRKSQPTNAVEVCVEALKRQPWKVHHSKVAPDVVASPRSTPVKVQSTNRAAPSASPYQSSSLKWRPIGCQRRHVHARPR